MSSHSEEISRWLQVSIGRLIGTQADTISPSAHPSACGVDSVAAAELASAARTEFGSTLDVADILGATTISQIASDIAAGIDLDRQGPIETAKAPNYRGQYSPGRSLSATQEAILRHESIGTGRSPYWVGMAFVVCPALHGPSMKRALCTVLKRVPVLTTGLFILDGQLASRQYGISDLDFADENVSTLEAGAVERLVTAQLRWESSLKSHPPLRIRLLQYNSLTIMVVNIHHVAVDLVFGRSLLAYLLHRYEAEAADPETSRKETIPTMPQVDADPNVEGTSDRSRAHERQLSNEPMRIDAGLALPLDRLHRGYESFAAGEVQRQLSEDVWSAIKDVAASLNTTPYVVFLVAVRLALNSYPQAPDAVFGTAMSFRSPLDDPIVGTAENLSSPITAGGLTNSVPLRIVFDNNQLVADHIRFTKQAVLECLARNQSRTAPGPAEGGSPTGDFRAIMRLLVIYEDVDPPWLDRLSMAQFRSVLRDQKSTRVCDDTRRIFAIAAPRELTPYELTVTIKDERDQSATVKVEFRKQLYRKRTAQQFLDRLLQTLEVLPDHLAVSVEEFQASIFDRSSVEGQNSPRELEAVVVNGTIVNPRRLTELFKENVNIRDAYVTLDPTRSSLCALVVPKSAKSDLGALRRELVSDLPGYLIPERLVFVSSIPDHPESIFDRDDMILDLIRANSLDQSPMHGEIVRMLRTTLRANDLDLSSTFVASGGHSLLAIHFENSVRDAWGVSIRVSEILGASSMTDIVAAIERRGQSSYRYAKRQAILAALDMVDGGKGGE